ncbi:thioesterase II family protein [Micromonospora sp. NPDC050397]|uniref:thioesterase II family protein n=1 Tax=Micromonospora sp. NPDC050397 TaxID=3364279 RepID=UPI00384C53D6
MTSPTGHTETWVRRYHPASSGAVRLLCLPHAGGSAPYFFPLSRLLSPAVEILPIQYPGRQDRRGDANVPKLTTLADQIFDAVRPLADRQLALFGHSMGAVLAYEVTLRLEDAGLPPVRLLASGRRAPSRYRDERVHQRDDRGVLAELGRLNGTDSAVVNDPELIEMIMPALRSDYQAIETYRHDPARSVRCPVTVLVGDQDPRVSLAEAEAWADHTSADADLRVFRGGHFYLTERIEEVAAVVSGALLGSASVTRD